MSDQPHPYATLTPDHVLDAVESLGLRSDGRQLTLNSFENRVYQVGMEDGPPLIAKFYRPQRWSEAQILEEHTFVAELAEVEIPAVPPLVLQDKTLHRYGDFSFALFPRQGGRAPELGDGQTLQWLGRFIGRIHAVGKRQLFRHRPALTPTSFGTESRDFLLEHQFIPMELESSWRSTVDMALQGVARAYERAGDVALIRLHGDCHMGNVLWTDEGPHFVDFDDSRSGPAIQDLWMLLSGNREEMQTQWDEVLKGYRTFCDFDGRELHLLEALRTLRLLHFSAWLARRWDDPAFPVTFPWFNTQRYWQDRILELREQIALMDEEPLIAN
jgi:Ser/Thr protein kinase RdoA (MazF antagonist)